MECASQNFPHSEFVLQFALFCDFFLQDLDVDLLAPAENGKTSVHYAAQAGQLLGRMMSSSGSPG